MVCLCVCPPRWNLSCGGRILAPADARSLLHFSADRAGFEPRPGSVQGSGLHGGGRRWSAEAPGVGAVEGDGRCGPEPEHGDPGGSCPGTRGRGWGWGGTAGTLGRCRWEGGGEGGAVGAGGPAGTGRCVPDSRPLCCQIVAALRAVPSRAAHPAAGFVSRKGRVTEHLNICNRTAVFRP